jgi:flagellar basal-body rod modification protein FlgD
MIDPTSTTSASSTSSTSATATSASNDTLDKNAFLQLLVAELQHQDPTDAQDPNQMVAQMAQFSTLEQQENTNTLLTGMQNQISALFQGQSANLIGQQVQVTNSSMTVSGGAGSVGVNLPSAANVVVTIQNSSGNTIATLNEGAMAAGSQVVQWNGKDSNGNQVADGAYTVSVSATGANGQAVAATTTSYATVTGVSFVNGTIMVTAGGQQYPLSAINAISS